MKMMTKVLLGGGSLVALSLLVSCIGSDDSSSDNETQQHTQQTVDEPNPLYLAKDALGTDLTNTLTVNNDAATIPAQCYTKTVDANQKVNNPCFSCHNANVEPNYVFQDEEMQLSYDFTTYSLTNRWTNLFKDRTDAVAAISDDDIIAYVRQSNYFDENGDITLAERLKQLPSAWDFNGNGVWDGYVPDIYFNFDTQGFDQDSEGNDTGWRAFGYSPFLGTFWPTNGSTDDVIIRLPEAMRQTTDGNYSRDVYKINLAIVEAMIMRKDITIDETDENLYGEDLNRNGKLDTATQVVYDWAPKEDKYMYYVGKANQLQKDGDLHLAAGLYPEGTEFVHSVRYIDYDDNGVKMAARIKELRYGVKKDWNNYSQLYSAGMAEVKEAEVFPDRLRTVTGNAETGVNNGLGWTYQGFIESADGELRPQNFEESMTCVGCHSGLAVTTDNSFAFPRKLDATHFQEGWYHWTQKGLEDIKEPKYSDGTYQYTEYLVNNDSANEFRNNNEVIAKFWDQGGNIKQSELETLHNDITHLLLPSKERALVLNKAYKVIVDEQSYIYGRDAHVEPLDEVVWKKIPDGETTGVTEAIVRTN